MSSYDTLISAKRYNNEKVVALKNTLRCRNLSQKGYKADMVARLEYHDFKAMYPLAGQSQDNPWPPVPNGGPVVVCQCGLWQRRIVGNPNDIVCCVNCGEVLPSAQKGKSQAPHTPSHTQAYATHSHVVGQAPGYHPHMVTAAAAAAAAAAAGASTATHAAHTANPVAAAPKPATATTPAAPITGKRKEPEPEPAPVPAMASTAVFMSQLSSHELQVYHELATRRADLAALYANIMRSANGLPPTTFPPARVLPSLHKPPKAATAAGAPAAAAAATAATAATAAAANAPATPMYPAAKAAAAGTTAAAVAAAAAKRAQSHTKVAPVGFHVAGQGHVQPIPPHHPFHSPFHAVATGAPIQCWEWEMYSGFWQRYPRNICKRLAQAKRDGVPSMMLELPAAPQDLTIKIDFKTMVQENTRTRATNALRVKETTEDHVPDVPEQNLKSIITLQLMGVSLKSAVTCLHESFGKLEVAKNKALSMPEMQNPDHQLNLGILASRESFETETTTRKEHVQQENRASSITSNKYFANSSILAACKGDAAIASWMEGPNKETFLKLLDEEKRCLQWYPESKHFFAHLGGQILEWAHQQHAQLKDHIAKAHEDLMSAVYSMPDMAGGTPRVFLKHVPAAAAAPEDDDDIAIVTIVDKSEKFRAVKDEAMDVETLPDDSLIVL